MLRWIFVEWIIKWVSSVLYFPVEEFVKLTGSFDSIQQILNGGWMSGWLLMLYSPVKYTDHSQMYSFSQGLSPQLQSHASSCLPTSSHTRRLHIKHNTAKLSPCSSPPSTLPAVICAPVNGNSLYPVAYANGLTAILDSSLCFCLHAQQDPQILQNQTTSPQLPTFGPAQVTITS